jgi:hypothetical protein
METDRFIHSNSSKHKIGTGRNFSLVKKNGVSEYAKKKQNMFHTFDEADLERTKLRNKYPNTNFLIQKKKRGTYNVMPDPDKNNDFIRYSYFPDEKGKGFKIYN